MRGSLTGVGKPVALGCLALIGALAALLLPSTAAAAPPASVFGGAVPCSVQGDGTTFCTDTPRSTVPAWDGVPIDVNVGLPSEADFGPGPYPLMMMFHGYGGDKIGKSGMQRWLDAGYATFSMTDRGFHESCGSVVSQVAAGAACDDGYVRLIDNRYEVRDAQEFAGALADEDLVEPKKIGSIGGSYGGGMSMALGALRNRVVMPDYSLVPWESPGGKPMEIAAATPSIPWTDLAYSLVPNGSTLDYVADAPYTGPVGVEKQSLVGGLYYSGLFAPGFYAPEGTDPTADLVGWQSLLEAGEPYGSDAQTIIDEITDHHSSYYIDHSIPPAPMLMSSGFTDDLFPADETIRYYNRTRTEYPDDSELALLFGDFGHPRAQNKSDVSDALGAAQEQWMDYYVLGSGPKPKLGVTAYTETCPDSAPSGGPYISQNWARMAKGEIRYDSKGAKTIAPDAGDPAIAAAFNPVGGSACGTAPGADQPGTASYRLDAAPDGGYTLMGAPTVIAKYTVPSDTIAGRGAAARRGTGRPGDARLARPLAPGAGGPTEQVFQLHPNGWNFAAGHVPKLELLPPIPTTGSPAATAAHRTVRDRSRSRTSSCACRSSRSPDRSVVRSAMPPSGSCPTAMSSPPTARRSATAAPVSRGASSRSRAASSSASSSARVVTPPATTSRSLPSRAARSRPRSPRAAQQGRRRFEQEAEAEAEQEGPQADGQAAQPEADAEDRFSRARRYDQPARPRQGQEEAPQEEVVQRQRPRAGRRLPGAAATAAGEAATTAGEAATTAARARLGGDLAREVRAE